MSSAETEAPEKVLEKEYDPPRIDKVRVEIDGQWGQKQLDLECAKTGTESDLFTAEKS